MAPSPCTPPSPRSTSTALVEPGAGGVFLAETPSSPVLNSVATVISFDDVLDENAQAVCCGLASNQSQGPNHSLTLGPDKQAFASRVAGDQKLHVNGPLRSTFPSLVVDRSANEPLSNDGGFFRWLCMWYVLYPVASLFHLFMYLSAYN
ncbi:hypothetical protein NC651_004401 [Populus alba x Populus x berolinensis]|nr:hypothetical protein NC651_004401 [Populus alba x Populus x berolinensis]